ncbi:hypothetical protein [Chryseobacterium sp. R2A-55]|uniref:hypothetical protein n=1 Tax=Chryseobacterium sp. R2A-55 TaxID=2744445 RepID=UPI001F31245F|nr:hypothetical protein [Chryseobacterium sp. R2A-55]
MAGILLYLHGMLSALAPFPFFLSPVYGMQFTKLHYDCHVVYRLHRLLTPKLLKMLSLTDDTEGV